MKNFRSNLITTILIIATLWINVVNATEEKPENVLGFFVGKWEGKATLFSPRGTNKLRIESVTFTCIKVLKETYVQCKSTWTNIDRKTRDLITFWNYDKQNDQYEILYIYDNWPGKVNYPLKYDSGKRLLTGSDTFKGPDGVAAKEKVEWSISKNGNEIVSREYNHYETDPDSTWQLSFEFILHKK